VQRQNERHRLAVIVPRHGDRVVNGCPVLLRQNFVVNGLRRRAGGDRQREKQQQRSHLYWHVRTDAGAGYDSPPTAILLGATTARPVMVWERHTTNTFEMSG